MAVNRFDKASQAQFINTYVPIPFDELAQASQIRQNRADKMQASLDAAQMAAANINAIPTATEGDVKIRNQIVSNVNNVIDKYAGLDLSDPEVDRQIRLDIRKAAPAEEIARLESNFANWQKAKDIKMKLEAERAWNPLLDDDPASNPMFGSQGEVYDYTPRGYYGKEKELLPYMAGLQQLTSKGFDEELGVVMMGRDSGDLEQVIGQYASQYAATPGGQDEIKLFKAQYPQQAVGMSDLEIAQQIMRDFGQQFLRTEYDPLPGYQRNRSSNGVDYGAFGRDNSLSVREGADDPRGTYNKVLVTQRDIERQLRDLDKQEGPVDETIRNQLLNQKADIDAVFAQANELYGEPSPEFNDNLNRVLNFSKQQAFNETFWKSSDMQNERDNVSRIWDEVLNKNILEGHDDVIGTKTYSGEEEFVKRLQEETTLRPSQIKKMGIEYGKAMVAAQNVADKDPVEAERMNFIVQNLTPLVQERRSLATPYYNQDGQLTYEKIDGYDTNGNPKYKEQPSYIATILEDANLNPDDYKINIDIPGGPRADRRMLRDYADGKVIIDPEKSSPSWVLSPEGEIKINNTFYDVNSGKKAGEAVVNVVESNQKNKIIKELLESGNSNNAYHISRGAWAIRESVKGLPFSSDGHATMDLPSGARASIQRLEGNEYEVTFFGSDGNPVINPYSQEPLVIQAKSLPAVADEINKLNLRFDPTWYRSSGYRW